MTAEEIILNTACFTLGPKDEAIIFVDRSAISENFFDDIESPLGAAVTVVFVDVPPGKTVRDCVIFGKRKAAE